MQSARARTDHVLHCAPLDDDDVDAGQGQFAGEHQPGRAASGDHHVMSGHERTSIASTMATAGVSLRSACGACVRPASVKVDSRFSRDAHFDNGLFMSPLLLSRGNFEAAIEQHERGLAASPPCFKILIGTETDFPNPDFARNGRGRSAKPQSASFFLSTASSARRLGGRVLARMRFACASETASEVRAVFSGRHASFMSRRRRFPTPRRGNKSVRRHSARPWRGPSRERSGRRDPSDRSAGRARRPVPATNSCRSCCRP